MQQGMVDDTSVRDMRIVRMKELTQILGISRSTIYDKLNPKSRRYDPRFPKPLRLVLLALLVLLVGRVIQFKIGY